MHQSDYSIVASSVLRRGTKQAGKSCEEELFTLCLFEIRTSSLPDWITLATLGNSEVIGPEPARG